MATYARAIANGKYLRNTRWASTDVGASPPETQLADFAAAFGIPEADIAWEIKPWDGVSPLPAEDEPDALVRLPVEPALPSVEALAKAALDTRYDALQAAATKELADKPDTRDALIALVDALKQG